MVDDNAQGKGKWIKICIVTYQRIFKAEDFFKLTSIKRGKQLCFLDVPQQ